MRFQYAGPGPVEVLSGGELIRPGDVREYDAAPDWGPWDLLDGPDTSGVREAGRPFEDAPPASPSAPLRPLQAPADPDPPQWPATPAVTPEGNK